jgi:hypothetical protein
MRYISQTRSPTRSGAAYQALNWSDSNSEGYQDTFHLDESMASFSFLLGCRPAQSDFSV